MGIDVDGSLFVFPCLQLHKSTICVRVRARARVEVRSKLLYVFTYLSQPDKGRATLITPLMIIINSGSKMMKEDYQLSSSHLYDSFPVTHL